MIDFRYHIVSLISVFLALAVGIILGAGPLKESIGDSLTGQVDALRADKDALRTELDGARTDLVAADDYIEAAAPALLTDLMPGTRVGIVQLGTVDDTLVTAVEEQVQAAGASVSVRMQVTAMWTDPEQADSRQSFATNLTAYLPDPSTTAGFDAVLAHALMIAMTSPDPTNADAFSSDATLVKKILVEGKLIETPVEPVAPADVILVLAPTAATTTPDTADLVKVRAAATVIELKIVAAAQGASQATVVAGTTPVEGDLVYTIRADKALAASTTTIVDVDQITGQVNAPLSLAAGVGGIVGQYGPGSDSTAPMPPRTPVESPVRGAATTDEGTGEDIGGDPATGEPATGDEGDAAGTADGDA